MARIPNDEIERIKREVDLKTLIESYGVELKPQGKDWLGLCPSHSDHNPSLVVSPEKGLFHCLGFCNDGGTVFDWIMKMEKASFRKSYEILKGRLPGTGEPPGEDKGGRALGSPTPAVVKSMTPKGQSGQGPLNLTGSFYHKNIDITSETTNQSLLNLVIDLSSTSRQALHEATYAFTSVTARQFAHHP